MRPGAPLLADEAVGLTKHCTANALAAENDPAFDALHAEGRRDTLNCDRVRGEPERSAPERDQLGYALVGPPPITLGLCTSYRQ